MKESFIIDNLNSAEIDAFVDIFLKTFDEKFLIPSIYRSPKIHNFISAELENPFTNTSFASLKSEDGIVGAAELKLLTEVVFVNMIGVKSDLKRRGYGSFFLGALFEKFKNLGFREFHLDVFESNVRALNWYLKNGFEVIGKKDLMQYSQDADAFSETIKFSILNFPQFSLESSNYGFSILKLKESDGQIYEVGKICNDFIIRSEVTERALSVIKEVRDVMSVENIYFFRNGESGINIHTTKLDSILRLKKIL